MSANIPPSSICYEFEWSIQLNNSPKTQFLSDFISIGRVENGVRFGVRCAENALPTRVISCYVGNLDQWGVNVAAVTCSDIKTNVHLLLKQVAGKTSGNLRLFTATQKKISTASVLTFTFRLYVTGSSVLYDVGHFDSLHGVGLWAATKNHKTTDFLFKVGDTSFRVHKFILSARSPVFRAMLSTDMIESRNGYVTIDDADPEIFRQFLFFVYTGQLDKPAGPELGKVADKYDVKTLSAICQQAMAVSVVKNDAENLFLLISLFDLDRASPATTTSPIKGY